ncbi:hypothetical protein [Carboxylicivirga marina]|uniref:hypothetical protein n=1 Tax=Carboxylicivirga marina TaxID=2800988 RepID=UPI002594F885|nr:hypothetical protein [uncultured Carboxylicivirga sp.]
MTQQGSKYYYCSDKSKFSNRTNPQLIKWNELYYITINEAIDHSQYFSVTVEKLERNLEKPKSSKYESVKPIIEDVFNDYYFNSLRYISEVNYKNGEFYIIKNNQKSIHLEHYCDVNKTRRHVKLDIYNNIEDLWITLKHDSLFGGRPGARKNGTPITHNEFQQYVNLTLKFLSDPNSYKIYLENFIDNLYKLTNGDDIIDDFDMSATRAFRNILKQLDQRKVYIEKQLIDNDELTKLDRVKLRGELDGIKYGIKTVKINR